MRRAILRPTLPTLGTDQLADLNLHQLLRDRPDDSRITSACSSRKTSRTTSVIVILS
jgi:hypothetical protein